MLIRESVWLDISIIYMMEVQSVRSPKPRSLCHCQVLKWNRMHSWVKWPRK
jgi:hypothetical protein